MFEVIQILANKSEDSRDSTLRLFWLKKG